MPGRFARFRPSPLFRRFLVESAVLHAGFFALWFVTPPPQRGAFERWSVLVAMVVAGLYYGGMSVAFVWARKSELNFAFAIQKLYWFALVAVLALPVQIGLITRHAPFRPNPYAIWDVPGLLRTYVWVFMSLSTMAVGRAFFRANGLRPLDPYRDLWRWARHRTSRRRRSTAGERGGADKMVSERPSDWVKSTRVWKETEGKQ